MYQSEFCEIYYFKKENVILLQWKKFCQGEEFREPLRFVIKELEHKKNSNFILDARKGFESNQEDSVWVLDKLLPEMLKTSCQKIIYIINDKDNTKEKIAMLNQEFQKHFEVKKAESLEDAFGEFSEESNKGIVLNVTYTTKPGKRDEFYQAINAAEIPRLSRKEEGNLRYEYYLPVDHNNEILLTEIWRDQEAVDYHRTLDHFKKLQEIKAEYVVNVRFEQFVSINY